MCCPLLFKFVLLYNYIMKIAVIADTHDNLFRLEKALKEIRNSDIKLLFHCGDIGTQTIEVLKAEKIKIYAVCGNNDHFAELEKLCKNSNIGIFEDIGEIEIDKRKIAITHLPKVAEYLSSLGKYNIIFFGHTHKKSFKILNNAKLVNPGDIMARHNKPSFLIYDTIKDNIEFVSI